MSTIEYTFNVTNSFERRESWTRLPKQICPSCGVTGNVWAHDDGDQGLVCTNCEVRFSYSLIETGDSPRSVARVQALRQLQAQEQVQDTGLHDQKGDAKPPDRLIDRWQEDDYYLALYWDGLYQLRIERPGAEPREVSEDCEALSRRLHQLTDKFKLLGLRAII